MKFWKIETNTSLKTKITEFGPFLTVKFLIEFSQNPEKYLRVCGFLKSQKDSLLGIQRIFTFM